MTSPSTTSTSVAFAAPFYATAVTLLAALLLTWLAAEVRAVRDRREKASGGATSGPGVRAPHAPAPLIAVALAGGLLVALRVLSRERAAGWETAAVWSAIGLGIVSVTASVGLATWSRSHPGRRPRRWWSWARSWGALAVAAVVGLAASPIVRGDDVRLVGARFAVYGTCLHGGCELKQRTGPGPRHSESPRHPRLPDGTMVRVVCQTAGPPVPGYRSNVWDRLDTGTYASDAFVDTPNRSGGYSEGLPRC